MVMCHPVQGTWTSTHLTVHIVVIKIPQEWMEVILGGMITSPNVRIVGKLGLDFISATKRLPCSATDSAEQPRRPEGLNLSTWWFGSEDSNQTSSTRVLYFLPIPQQPICAHAGWVCQFIRPHHILAQAHFYRLFHHPFGETLPQRIDLHGWIF